MSLRLLGLLLALSFAEPARAAGEISVVDAVVRALSPSAPAAAAFMTIVNSGETDDRLLATTSDAAVRVELHTHLLDAAGVMRMVAVDDGIPLPAGGSHSLERGGDHIMFMGLTRPFVDGESIAVTLVFENAGEIVVDIPIVNAP